MIKESIVFNFANMIESYQTTHQSFDKCHNILVFALVTCMKPDEILELGYGSGFVTESLKKGIAFNGKGHITCVDNWQDFNYKEPTNLNVYQNISFVSDEEKNFIENCENEKYDFVIQDASHMNYPNKIQNLLRITKSCGCLMIHDSNQILNEIPKNILYYNFKKTSTKTERCQRGLCIIFKENFSV